MIHPEDCPIVVFGDDWGRRVSSMQHVFREIVERRRVVWVNGIGHRVPSLRAQDVRRAWEKARSMLRARSVPPAAADFDPRAPAVVLQPRVLPWHHWDLVLALNRRTLLGVIREALAGIDAPVPPVIVTGSPPSTAVVGRLGELASVYFCMDDFLHLEGVSPEMLGPLERRLLRKVDAVVATARSLVQTKVPRSGAVHYLPQGVNYEHFATPRPTPPEIARLPRPVIGFAGGVSTCCDFPLIRRVAETHPRASVVLVGPVTAPDISALALPNVHVLGPRPYRDLPAYVQTFDVGLIPYVLNAWTQAVDPLKLLEYLAAGVPVVTTDIPEVHKYAHAVSVAGTHDAFVEEVARALAEPREAHEARGRAVAREQSWRCRADTLLDILDDLVRRRVAARAVAAV